MKLSILLIIMTFSCTLLAQDLHKEFRVQANIRGLQTRNNYVYLRGRIDGLFIMDSAYTNDGRFSFSGKSEPDMVTICYYRPGEPKMSVLLSCFLDKGEITVTGTYDTSMLTYVRDVKIKGSHNQDEIDRFDAKSMKALANGRDFKRLKLEYDAAKKNKDSAVVANLLSVYKEYYRLLPDYKFDYIRSNPQSVVSLYFLEKMILGSDEKTLDTAMALFKRLAPARQSSVNGQKIWNAMTFAARSMLIGKPFMDFSGITPDGKAVKLSDYKGSYVLLEFWASWCGPCRAENPNVLRAFKQYQPKGFNVMGVSLDSDTTEWKKAVLEDKLPWQQIYDLREPGNSPSDLYGISAIPDNFLINPEGIVIARGLRAKDLHQKLMEVYVGK